MSEQLLFRFVTNTRSSRGCPHVSRRKIDGSLLDGTVRVCSSQCANNWLRPLRRTVVGEHFVTDGNGRRVRIEYTSGFTLVASKTEN